MKKLYLLIFLLSFNCFSQAFEGEIIYSNEYKSKSSEIKDEVLNSTMGTKQQYFIKNGNYKSVTNGNFLLWQLYIAKENKLYNKVVNSESLLWNDAAVQGDEILNVQINKNVTSVLEYKCDEIILTCKSGIQKYYYNSKFSVDVSKFINHKLGNWYDFVSRSNSLPLKIVLDNPQFIFISTAVEIKSLKLDDILFMIPENVKTEKSPW